MAEVEVVEDDEDIRTLPAGYFDGKLVEFHGVGWAVEAYDCELHPIGELVEPDGKRGIARWHPEWQTLPQWQWEEYLVETTDGLVLQATERQLREPEDVLDDVATGGPCDLDWPSVPFSRVAKTFGLRVAQKLRVRGHCVIDMPCEGELGQLAAGIKHFLRERTDWTLPHAEFEEIYLGLDHGSKVAWLAAAEPPHDLFQETFLGYWRRMLEVTEALGPWSEPFLCFRASSTPACPCLRTSASDAELEGLRTAPLSDEDAQSGLVAQHLDFVQRRKICMLYFLVSGGGVELFRRGAAPGEPPVFQMRSRPDRLVLFRHDLFSYRCSAGAHHGSVLQSWILEVPQALEISNIVGSQRRLQALLGGPTLALEKQVHVMACHCVYPGNTWGYRQDWLTYTSQTDTFIKIPATRFDIDLYWEEAGQFNSSGKSSTRHCGHINDEELMCFDNELFDIPGIEARLIPPIHRMTLETSFTLLALAGFTRESLRGQKMYFANADIGLEWDWATGYREDPVNWVKSGLHNLIINRMMAVLGIDGPCHQCDTACSASLVASNLVHAYLRKEIKDVKMGLSMGGQSVMMPWPLIGLSSAGMLGSGGRCKTFDQSANGYNRGEGTGGLFSKVSSDVEVITDRLACYVSSYINQDGRSASLTAPNGPSQQAVVRGSLLQGEIQSDWVSCTENHGTGTALGDPIETGTIKSVFRKRETALPVTSAKSHMGHLECGAGSVGILKTILSIVYGGVPANCHLRMPNAHCETEGFPGIFPVELCDIGTEYHYGGCNGFGFGGTNCRADFWALRRNTVHNYKDSRRELRLTKPLGWGDFTGTGIRPHMPRIEQLDFVTVECAQCLGPMCWLCGLAPPEEALPEKHHCADVREDGASYAYCSRCYEGGYVRRGSQDGGLPSKQPEQTVHLWGSWNAWTALSTLSPVEGSSVDAWEAEVTIGDTLLEQFCIVVRNGRERLYIQPPVRRAGQMARGVGPSAKYAQGQHWLIDGRREGARVEGTVFVVRLEWGANRMAVSWRLELQALGLPLVRPVTFQHQYFIANSLSGWRPVILTHDRNDRYLWRAFASRIPESGRVEIIFMRDADRSQVIYPMFTDTVKAASVVQTSGGRPAQDSGSPVTKWYEVVHDRVTIRAGPSTTAPIVKQAKSGEGFRGTKMVVQGKPWLRLDEGWVEECRRDIDLSKGVQGLWVLIDGESNGLGELLKPGVEPANVVDKASDTVSYCEPEASVPIAGPDEGGDGKRFVAFGQPGEKLLLDLRVRDGQVRLTCRIGFGATTTWRGSSGMVYSIAGSFNNWLPTFMHWDTVSGDGAPRYWRALFTVGFAGREEFQLLANQSWHLRLYPGSPGAAPGTAVVLGPDRKGKGKNWEVMAPPGTEMEVKLDLEAEDPRDRVTCAPVGDLIEIAAM